ncbi:MAG: ion transporter [Chitinophagales bacterium]
MSKIFRSNHKKREELYHIIFGTDTPAGKAFDVVLLVLIVLSIILVMLESVEDLNQKYHHIFVVIEWFLTIIFTVEYLVRLYVVRRPLQYMTSFFGIVDFMAILPSYLSLILVGAHYFLVVRALRLLRIFRVFKLGRYLGESQILIRALQASRVKITVFLIAVLTAVTVIGAIMYLVESRANSGFDSIPRSVYWAIVTITTVGYGDIAPATTLGQFLAAVLMILGYAIIAVPTGIVSVELAQAQEDVRTELKDEIHEITHTLEELTITKSTNPKSELRCGNCERSGHDVDAEYCKYCGEVL